MCDAGRGQCQTCACSDSSIELYLCSAGKRVKHSGMDLTLSILMLAAIALMAGAGFLWFKRNERKQASLMALLALIMIANIAIWLVPTSNGESPAEVIEN